MLLHNVVGDIERIVDDMYLELRDAIPYLGRDRKIGIVSWEYDHRPGRSTEFSVWHKDHFIDWNDSHDIPIEDWDAFIAHYKLLFRRF